MLARDMVNKDRYRPSCGCLSLGWCREVRVCCVPFTLVKGVSLPRGEPPHREGGRRVGFGHGEFVGCSFARGQYEYGGNDHSFRS
jgi:hypothetical protein